MKHHAFVIEAEAEKGIEIAQEWLERELELKIKSPSTGLGVNNPDVIVLRYGLFSVADARRVNELAMQAPLRGKEKVLIIAAARAYHEAQNALLKLFEEPPVGTYLFLILPTLGGLLPTLRSRVQVLKHTVPRQSSGRQEIPQIAEEFLAASKEKRSAIIKKLTSGRDEEERRAFRDEAIAIVNGIEAVVYDAFHGYQISSKASPQKLQEYAALLSDIATLRGYLYDRSAPVRMILEHLSIVLPHELGKR